MNPPRIALFAEQGHFTAVHNLTFRVVMPQISSSAWKVLCFLISETVGYNRRSELISYSAIMAGTGIRSSATVAKSLAELLEGEPFGCPLIVRKVGAKCGAASHESARYGLNLKCTVALQKMKREDAGNNASKSEASKSGSTSKNEARRTSKSEARRTSKSEAPAAPPIRSARGPTETSNRQSHSLSSVERQKSEDEIPLHPVSDEAVECKTVESAHFLALCEVCELDRAMMSGRRRANALARAAQLATKYTPEQIYLAGSRWALPTAPHPDQLLDGIQALLRQKEAFKETLKETDETPSRPRVTRDSQRQNGLNDHQRNAAQRRELMAELARRFG